ncbi:MAG: ROK family protein, partial [bacterium]|nr:ROK family protein [bacterium]
MSILGLDLGGTRLKAIWWKTDSHTIIEQTAVDLPNTTLPVFLEAVQSLASKRTFSAIGVGIPGTLDKPRENVVFVPNLSGWGIVPLKKLLQEQYQVPVVLENDANLAALAEYQIGAGKGTCGIVLLTLGTGIGGGVVIDGNVLTGAKGGGAELGHYCIDPNGPPCNCGSNGCLEVYTGRDGIIRRGAEKHPGRANWTPLDWSNA